jgi:hypothetical protein
MIQLERYKGTKSRHTCPACNQKNQFTRFVDDAGNYIADNVGICNRSSKCGYRYTAKQYYADNPTGSNFAKTRSKKRSTSNYGFAAKPLAANTAKISNQTDYIPIDSLKATLGNYDRNAFVQFLFDLFPDDADEINNVLKMYFVGTYLDHRGDYICFPSIDRLNRICRSKLIRFDSATGKRLKGRYDTSALPSKLKLKEDFNYKQIFFGEHLLPKELNKPVAIVESEKTAIIASLCMSQFVWLATGSKQWLKAERLQKLDNRQIILYPDADGFNQWQAVASDAQKLGVTVKVSALIENFATDEQKRNQYDLADYFIEQQREINQINEFIDSYNSRYESTDEAKYADFETILDERISIVEIGGNLSRIEAETVVANAPDYLERVVSEFIN